MSIDDPNDLIGKRESATLEFKAQEILKAPAKIAREVVGFLNASGGHVWIGVQENGGVAVPPLQARAGMTQNSRNKRYHERFFIGMLL